jgi:hypothetical protein
MFFPKFILTPTLTLTLSKQIGEMDREDITSKGGNLKKKGYHFNAECKMYQSLPAGGYCIYQTKPWCQHPVSTSERVIIPLLTQNGLIVPPIVPVVYTAMPPQLFSLGVSPDLWNDWLAMNRERSKKSIFPYDTTLLVCCFMSGVCCPCAIYMGRKNNEINEQYEAELVAGLNEKVLSHASKNIVAKLQTGTVSTGGGENGETIYIKWISIALTESETRKLKDENSTFAYNFDTKHYHEKPKGEICCCGCLYYY